MFSRDAAGQSRPGKSLFASNGGPSLARFPGEFHFESLCGGDRQRPLAEKEATLTGFEPNFDRVPFRVIPREFTIRARTTRKIALGEAYLGGVGEESTCAFGTSSTAGLTVPDAFTVTVGAGDVALSAVPGFLSQLAIAAATRRPVTRFLIFIGDCRFRIDYLRL